MSPKGKIILAVSLSVVAIGAGVLAYGAWTVYSFLNSVGVVGNVAVPTELSEPRVLKGNDLMTQQAIFKKLALSRGDVILKAAGITDEEERERFINSESSKQIYGFSDVARCGDEIVAVGKFGGYRLDLDGNLKETVSFEPFRDEIKILFWRQKHLRQTLDDLRILDVEGDGRCEFVSNSSIDGVTYFNADGKVNWRYGSRKFDVMLTSERGDNEAWVTRVDFGDVDDDGKLDFLISKKADGIRAFSADQREIWFQPDEFPTAELIFIDTDRDGKNELVEFHGGSSNLRDKRTGKILHPLKLGGSAAGIFEVVDGKKKGEVQIYEIAENKLIVTDLLGKELYRSDAPLSEVPRFPAKGRASPAAYHSLAKESASSATYEAPVNASSSGTAYQDDTESIYEPRAQMVRLQAGKPKYLVILASFISIPRTNLYVYGPGGELVYHELLAEDAETLSLITDPDGTEGFLVGGKDTIWKYTAK